MTTTLVDSITGDAFYLTDLPILHQGMLLSIRKKFAARRITDVHLYIDEQGTVYKQVLILGTKGL